MPSPQEVLDAAEPGDTVRITFRGPSTEEELSDMLQEYKRSYPQLDFELRDQGAVHSAELIRTSPEPAPDIPGQPNRSRRIVMRSDSPEAPNG